MNNDDPDDLGSVATWLDMALAVTVAIGLGVLFALALA